MLPPSAGELLYLLATTSLLALRASADSTNWLFPAYSPNAPPISFQSQDTIDAAWTSAFVAPVLVLFCQTNNDGDFSIDFQSPAPVLPNGSYAIPLDSVQTANQHCHLNLNETNGPLMGTANSSNSGNFLVDDQSDRSATTWSTSIATSTASPSPSTPTTTPTSTPASKSRHPNAAAATTTGTSPSPTAPPTTGLSTGAKAGIGVGVTLGVLAFLAAALFLWMRARKKKQPRNPAFGAEPEFESMPKKPEHGGEVFASEVAGHHPLSEMDGSSSRQEEKDGFPIARRETVGELEADPVR